MTLRKALLAFAVMAGVFVIGLPIDACAQQPKKVLRIGFLRVGTVPVSKTFWDAMREHGWVEGRNVKLEPRSAENSAQLSALAAELVKLDVDIIITNGTPATLAAKKATQTIPIVFFLAADPVRNGVVASIARPGGNATGFAYGLYGHKLLDLLKAALPAISRVAYPVLAGDAGES